MDILKTYQWLLDIGGPSIHLLLNRIHQVKSDQELYSKLLKIEKVKETYDYLDGFNTELRDKKTLEHLIHYYKPSSVENFFPLLMDYGFSTDYIALDEKMKSFRDIFSSLRCDTSLFYYAYSLMVHQHFFKAGLIYKEVINSMIERINKLHYVSTHKIYNIYDESGNLPKIPTAFSDRKAVKKDLNPFDRLAKTPLPTIYDLHALAHFPLKYKTPIIEKKINDIISYILQPEFQKLPSGYGVIYSYSVKRYHACGWSPTLPNYLDYPRPKNFTQHKILPVMEIMSKFKVAHNSTWFTGNLSFLDHYKTKKGTFSFPQEFLRYKYQDQAFLNDSIMTTTRNVRKEVLLEVISTIKMYEIYYNIKKI